MNNHASESVIEISKSSLLSLKAEVFRKQQELNKAKLQAQAQVRVIPKFKNVEPRKQPEKVKVVDAEEEELLRKSRAALESKSRLYDKLVRDSRNFTDDDLEENRRYLVRFDHKQADESDEERHFSDEYDPPTNPDEEWVEYTDCLGRTRKCLRGDLEFIKAKDEELKSTLGEDGLRRHIEAEKPKQSNETDEPKPAEVSEDNELLSSDMRQEILRQQWEKQEEALRNKDDIHYQDVLFNEARTHGVGYYGFSQDEEVRLKQQQELKKLREETMQRQKVAEEQRLVREKQLSARLKAARNRKRARMGLPPEEDEPEPLVTAPVANENEEDKKKAAELEAQERLKEEERKKKVRPWDIGKRRERDESPKRDPWDQKKRKHEEYTQEEWVDKKRRERTKEFAPPSMYSGSEKYRSEETEEVNKSLFFTTKKSKKAEEHSGSFKPVRMVNECSDSEESDGEEERREVRKGAEIPPPATFEYYGPESGKRSKTEVSKDKLEESISAGLKFLRQQQEKKEAARGRREFSLDL